MRGFSAATQRGHRRGSRFDQRHVRERRAADGTGSSRPGDVVTIGQTQLRYEAGTHDAARSRRRGRPTQHRPRAPKQRGLLPDARADLFMVADGMGGAAAGEVASAMCAEAFAEIDLVRTARRRRPARTRSARPTPHPRARPADPRAAGMGTTVTAALVGEDGRIAFAHVGDSRAYLLRDGSLQRLSDDHSVVARAGGARPDLRAGGGQPSAEERGHAGAGRRAVGARRHVLARCREGDLVLLCSDGLTDMVSEERFAALLGSGDAANGSPATWWRRARGRRRGQRHDGAVPGRRQRRRGRTRPAARC